MAAVAADKAAEETKAKIDSGELMEFGSEAEMEATLSEAATKEALNELGSST